MRDLLLYTLAGVSCVPSVLGWGAAGHEIVATIAQIYTEPAALEKLCTILNAHTYPNHLQDNDTEFMATDGDWPCHIASIATWADRFKYSMRWSAPLHYVGAVGDHPSDTCMFPGENGKWAGRPNINVLGGIYNTSTILMDWADGANTDVVLAQEALKFLVHFVGDLHMPLHLTGRDRGGNQVDVCFDGRRTNLHSVWDTYLPAKAIRSVGYNYSRPLPSPFEKVERNLRGAIYDPLVRKIIWEGIEDKWFDDVPEWVTCEDVTGPEPEQSTMTVWRTLRDFFLPSWFSGGDDSVPVVDTKFICPYYWSKPIHALNCELIWPKDLDEEPSLNSRILTNPPRRPRCRKYPHFDGDDNEDMGVEDTIGEPPYEIDNPDYMGPIEERMLLEQFFAQGGVRLAGILNYIFGSGNVERVTM